MVIRHVLTDNDIYDVEDFGADERSVLIGTGKAIGQQKQMDHDRYFQSLPFASMLTDSMQHVYFS